MESWEKNAKVMHRQTLFITRSLISIFTFQYRLLLFLNNLLEWKTQRDISVLDQLYIFYRWRNILILFISYYLDNILVRSACLTGLCCYFSYIRPFLIRNLTVTINVIIDYVRKEAKKLKLFFLFIAIENNLYRAMWYCDRIIGFHWHTFC